MTKYILHGGFTRDKNELNRTFYEELTKDVPENGTVLFCYFAGRDEDIGGKFDEDRKNVTTEAHGKKMNVVLAAEENFLAGLDDADALYIRGGDTQKLLAALRRFPGLKEKMKGKTVAGSSAGAYALSAYFYSNTMGGVFEGLGMLPVRTACHYQSEKDPNRGDPVAALEEYPRDLELVILRDYEWKTFTRMP